MPEETVKHMPGQRPCVMIEVEGGALLGYKRAQLLEGIGKFSSIFDAATYASIPYEHAMELVDLMNGHSYTPLVEISDTAGHNSGAKLTAEGKKAMMAFWILYEEFKLSLCDQLKGRPKRKYNATCTTSEG